MKYFFSLSVIFLFITSCDKIILGSDEPIVSLQENLLPPLFLDDGWAVSNLLSENINENQIHSFISSLHKSNPKNIHSLLIIRGNKLVSESYFQGWHRDRLHTLRSASKSFISTLTGIGIDKGVIRIDDKLFDFFPEYSNLNSNQKNKIEIKHVLSMTMGFYWNEKTNSAIENDEYLLDRSDDRLKYILGKEIEALPGEKFVYNSGGPFLQAALLQKATGQDIESFAKENLFNPLGITNYFLRKEGDGLISATGPLLLRPRDMAKLGQLFLDKGKWKGKQIISEAWVNDATKTFSNEYSAKGYGYNWWVETHNIKNKEVRTYFARGNGGQYIIVAPSLNTVLVFTGGKFSELEQGFQIGSKTIKFILSAVNV